MENHEGVELPPNSLRAGSLTIAEVFGEKLLVVDRLHVRIITVDLFGEGATAMRYPGYAACEWQLRARHTNAVEFNLIRDSRKHFSGVPLADSGQIASWYFCPYITQHVLRYSHDRLPT